MNIIKTHFRSGDELLEHYLGDLPHGGLFIPTRRTLTPGESIVVSVRVGPRRGPVLLRSVVAWRRPGKHLTKTRAGIGVEFLSTEVHKRDYLLAVARGHTAEMSARRHQRLPIDLPVHWQIPGTLQDNRGILRDIGRGGAFVMTDERVAVETDVVLKVAPPGAEVEMPVSARIAWLAPLESIEPGFGIAWKARDAGGTRRIKELVRRMEGLTSDGNEPDGNEDIPAAHHLPEVRSEDFDGEAPASGELSAKEAAVVASGRRPASFRV
jgi:Tfp pilus assembly protein PilZ